MEHIHQARTQLVEAEKLASLGRFIADIAHETNNHLMAVVGYADFLAGAELAPSRRRCWRSYALGPNVRAWSSAICSCSRASSTVAAVR
jgi:signal transduction histidine kinase